jgi:hypothetical protein
MSYLFGQRKIALARSIIAAISRPVKLSMLKFSNLFPQVTVTDLDSLYTT